MLPRALRTGSSILVAAAAAVTACGHLPFDELPAAEDALLHGDSGPDAGREGGPGDDGATTGDGGGVIEAGPFLDAEADAIIEPPPIEAGADASPCGAVDCEAIIYVSMQAGVADATGGPSDPVASIAQALKINSDHPERYVIRVTGGTYPEFLQITKRVEIQGGWTCDKPGCIWLPPAVDTKVSATVVQASDLAGAARIDGVGQDTVIDRVHFVGAGPTGIADATAAFTLGLFAATPTLKNLTIDGPKTNSGTPSAALLIGGTKRATPVVIDGCTISGGGGGGADSAYAVAVGALESNDTNQPSVAAVIQNHSTISGGKAKTAVTIAVARTASLTILDSDVQAGGSTANTNQMPRAWAIAVRGSATILRSRINPFTISKDNSFCQSDNLWCGGIEVTDGVLTLKNDLVAGVPATNSAAVSILASTTASAATSILLDSNVLDGSGLPNNGATSTAIRVLNTGGGGAGTLITGTVRNSILRGGRAPATNYAVYEGDMGQATAHLAHFDHNDIRTSTYAYRAWVTASPPPRGVNYIFAKLSESPLGPAQSDNTNVDCKLDEITFKLDPTSPCIDEGGFDKTTTPIDDYFGNDRPKFKDSDIGLYESPTPRIP